MSIAAIRWATGKRVRSGAAKAVLLAVANHANRKGQAWPSQATLADETARTDRAVRRALKGLEDDGLIVRKKRGRGDGKGRTSDLITLLMAEEPSENIARLSGTKRPVNKSGFSGQIYTGKSEGHLPDGTVQGTYLDIYKGLARKTKSDRFISADIIPFARKNEAAA